MPSPPQLITPSLFCFCGKGNQVASHYALVPATGVEGRVGGGSTVMVGRARMMAVQTLSCFRVQMILVLLCFLPDMITLTLMLSSSAF